MPARLKRISEFKGGFAIFSIIFGTALGTASNTAIVGGAIDVTYLSSCDILNGSVFATNEATEAGGAIAMMQSEVTITDSFFERCATTFSDGMGGGAIYCFGATLQIVNTEFIENTAGADRGRGVVG